MKEIEELRKVLASMSVNELMILNNETAAEIRYQRHKSTQDNIRILDAEIRNLLDGVGDGYTPADSYAPDRYYSSIEGVKNIRIYTEMKEQKQTVKAIAIKLLSPKGKLLTEKITVRNIEYNIVFWKSKKYTPTVDY